MSLPDDTFPLVEPYYSIQSVSMKHPDMVPRLMHALGGQFPLPSIFLDCSFVENDVTFKPTFWLFACDNIPWIARDSAMHQACVKASLDKDVVRNKCTRSTHRVAKFLRIPWLLRQPGINAMSLFDDRTKIIHVVRHPAATLRSRIMALWHVTNNRTYAEEAFVVCNDMAVHVELLKLYPPDTYITVKYENLFDRFDSTFLRMQSFVGVDVSEDLLQQASTARQAKHADIPHMSDHAPLAVFEDLVRLVDPCANVMDQLGYK